MILAKVFKPSAAICISNNGYSGYPATKIPLSTNSQRAPFGDEKR